MTGSSQAVFLSYAREDAAAARRIAEALRSHGLEVWFDENELRGGDAWDAKIKKQIRECSLFMPMVSAHTEERAEGYFRREWKLAVDRTSDMVAGATFIVPVVADDTREADAAVPEEFLRYQWVRLPGALPTPQFVEQVKRLLDAPKRTAAGNSKTGDRVRRTDDAEEKSKDGTTRKFGLPAWAWGTAVAVIAGVSVMLFLVRKPAPAPTSAIAAPIPSTPAKLGKSIAVLPFVNRSNRDDDAFFTDGIHDELLTQIAHVRSIKTISRTSVMQYRGTAKTVKTIGGELGVTTILEGGVQRSGNQVRINVQLIDVATDSHLWAEVYDRELTAESLFKVQSEIAQAIARALQAVLSPEEQKRIEKTPTRNLAALEAYFQAKMTGSSAETREGFAASVAHLDKAIELDPGFALAYVARAQAYLGQIWFVGLPVEAQTAKALADVAKALELDNRLGAAYSASGFAKYYLRDTAGSEADFKRALELGENDSYAHMGYGKLLLWTLNRPAEALVHFRKATELDPQGLKDQFLEVEALQALGRNDEARAILEAAMRQQPDNPEVYRLLGGLYAGSYNRYDEAIRWMRKGHALAPHNPNFPQYIAAGYWALGDRNEAARWIQRALVIAPQNGDAAVLQGYLYLYRGEKEKALDLFRSVSETSTMFGAALWELKIADLTAGRVQAARARYAKLAPGLMESANPVVNEANFYLAADVAEVLQATGEREQAARLLAGTLAVLPKMTLLPPAVQRVAYAVVYALQGDKRRALDALREAYDAGLRDGFMNEYPEFATLRDDPEFKALVAKMRADLDTQLAHLRQMEAKGELAPMPDLTAKP